MPYSREERACLQRGTKKKEGGRRKCRRLAARGQTVADSAETGQLRCCSHRPPVCVPITAPDFHQKKNTSNAQDAYYYQPPTGIDIITDQVLNHVHVKFCKRGSSVEDLPHALACAPRNSDKTSFLHIQHSQVAF